MSQPSPPRSDATAKEAAPTPAPEATGSDIGQTMAQPSSALFATVFAPSQSADEIGRLGSCRILRLIGEGGMGCVFEAEDVMLKRRVAVKIMRPEIAALSGTRTRFLREAQAAALLRDDHVVPIYQVGEENSVPYLVMPFLPGESLHDRLKRSPRPTLLESVRYARQAAQGLAAAHAAGLVHRDIKPANLWIEEPSGEAVGIVRRPRVRILDFGLARATSDEQVTRSGQLLGTPAYMAPEQARGSPPDFRADLFSLGTILYEMVAGQRPFKGHDVWTTLFSVVHDNPAPPAEIDSSVPPELSALVMRLLAKEPGERPPSTANVVVSLGAIEKQLAAGRATPKSVQIPPQVPDVAAPANFEPVFAPVKSTNPKPAPRTPRRSRRNWILMGTLLLIAGPMIGMMVHRWPTEMRKRQADVLVASPPASPAPPNDLVSPPPPVPELRLKPLPPITISAGESASVVLAIERKNLSGEVTLAVSNLPTGIVLQRNGDRPLTIPVGESEITIKLNASRNALPGVARITISASAGNFRDSQESGLTVLSAMTPKLVLKAPSVVKLKTGQETTIDVSVDGQFVIGAVKLEWLDLPAGIRSAGSLPIRTKSGRAQLTLAADSSAQSTGTARLRASVGDIFVESKVEMQVEGILPPVLDSTNGAIDVNTVKKTQQQWADYLGKKVIEEVNLGAGVKMEFVLIPPGEFMMGSPESDKDAADNERPQHRVRISKPFYLARTHVTHNQFRRFESKNYESNPSVENRRQSWNAGKPYLTLEHPVSVGHESAERFCVWLGANATIDSKAQLPSEAQWEHSCRAGTTSRYLTGEDPDSLRGFGNFADEKRRVMLRRNSDRNLWFEFNDGYAYTSPVGKYFPNALGLFDMSGNVWQWCNGGLRLYKNHFEIDPSDDPINSNDPSHEYALCRGNAFDSAPPDCRVSRRHYGYQQSAIGFRPALILPTK